MYKRAVVVVATGRVCDQVRANNKRKTSFQSEIDIETERIVTRALFDYLFIIYSVCVGVCVHVEVCKVCE